MTPKKKIIISFDPSSTKTGFAFGVHDESIPHFQLKGGGVIDTDPTLTPSERIDGVVDSINELMEQIEQLKRAEHCYAVIALVEVPSGRVNHERHRGRGAGLAIYGEAVGAVRQFLRWHTAVTRVVAIPESWTGGFSKERRISTAAHEIKWYDPTKDRGGDFADAACMIMIATLRKMI